MPNEESKPVDKASEEADASKALEELNLSPDQIANLLAANPALRGSLPASTGGDQDALKEALKKLSPADLITGMGKGKNAKDMASYKFWSTQPVTRFDEASLKGQTKGASKDAIVEGQIKPIDKDRVPKDPAPLIDGFEWCEMDLQNAEELEEVRSLLSGHYVEDDEALFRFNYSQQMLRWAMMAPGWKKTWHVGVRTTSSKKLVAYISAIPLTLYVKDRSFLASEVNFLCVHKKLRAKRLAPVLITEITRRSYVNGIYQGIYTGGILLPTPVASCRYFHRALDWEKLYTVGFSPMPRNSTKQRQIAKFKLPERTSTPGLRLMEEKDVAGVADLLRRYLRKMQMSQHFNDEEAKHWLLDKESDPKSKDRVVWTYVAEKDGKIVDVISYYALESSVLNQTAGNSVIRAAYLFYYATESAFQDDEKVLSDRLNGLVRDALISAKQSNFDVFNALTLLDNPLFLQKQLFGPGDSQLHYYLFNYRVAPVNSGVDDKNQIDEKKRRGVGVVML
ncbi:hypothetical protein ANO11243_074580 [Dothideomycetidae sp. 11243]|nr:hypothetical protein ANO11243_074580 [fungal sp. No.11243]